MLLDFAMQWFRQASLPCWCCFRLGLSGPEENAPIELRRTWTWQAAIKNASTTTGGETWLGLAAGEAALPFFPGRIPLHKTTNTHSDRGALSVVITGDNCLIIISIISYVVFFSAPPMSILFYSLFWEHSCGSCVCACVCVYQVNHLQSKSPYICCIY